MLAKKATRLLIISALCVASTCYAMDFEHVQDFEFWNSSLYAFPFAQDGYSNYSSTNTNYNTEQKTDYIDLHQFSDPAIGAGFAEVGLYTIESLKIDRAENLAGEQNHFRDDPDGLGFFIRKRFE